MGGSYVGTSIYSTQLTQLQYCRTYCELLIGAPDTVQCILELVMLVHSCTMLYFTVQCYTLELYICTVEQMPPIILYMYISYLYLYVCGVYTFTLCIYSLQYVPVLCTVHHISWILYVHYCRNILHSISKQAVPCPCDSFFVSIYDVLHTDCDIVSNFRGAGFI